MRRRLHSECACFLPGINKAALVAPAQCRPPYMSRSGLRVAADGSIAARQPDR